MRNNIRRSRNIGTPKQGYGQNNRMIIPEPLYKKDFRSFYERLEKYEKYEKIINGHSFTFIIEDTIESFHHACSIGDVIRIIENIPPEDYGEMKYIIFRQPKRKEVILSSVWGRLIYSYKFEDNYYPAIILEAFSDIDKIIRTKRLSLFERKEFERLKKDGHQFIEDKRNYTAKLSEQNVRKTQLYRTLLHEFGHYVHYLGVVEICSFEDEEFDEWERRYNFYHNSISSFEKEKFAHKYAEKLKNRLEIEGVIPFDKIENNNDLATNTK